MDVSTGYVWLLLVVLGIGTFGLRLSFIQLHGRLDEFPQWVDRGLTFVPASILAALVFSELFTLDGSIAGTVVDARLLAAGLAAVIAWRTGSVMATIAVGMGALWVSSLLLG